VYSCLGFLLLAPGIGLSTFCCAESGTATSSICPWYGPYIILTALTFAAFIPLAFLALEWLSPTQTHFLKRNSACLLPWVLLIFVIISFFGAVFAKPQYFSSLPPDVQTRCTNKADKLMTALQNAWGYPYNQTDSATNVTTTITPVTMDDAFRVQHGSFVASAIFSSFIIVLLIISSYKEMCRCCLKFNAQSLQDSLLRRGSRRLSQSLNDGKEMKEIIVPQRLRDGQETVRCRMIQREGNNQTVLFDNFQLANLRGTHTVKDLEERIALLPQVLVHFPYGTPVEFQLEFQSSPMIADRRLSSYPQLFVRDQTLQSDSNQIVIVHTPASYR